jgi:hypothetical protein
MRLIEDLHNQIFEIQDKIKTIQSQCSHPESAVESKNSSATGDPYSNDEYWTDNHCQLCGKKWRGKQ